MNRNHVTRRQILASIPAGAVLAGAALAAPAVASQGQPHMANALEALRTAKQQLNAAAADKGGHRVKAINLVEQAIAEVQRGMAAANPN